MPFAVVLFLALLPQASTNPRTKDALALLNEVGQRYADAKSYHVEAIVEETTSNELSRNWTKTFLTAIVSPEGHYRYGGRSGLGAATLVSDGVTEWDYHADEHLYTESRLSSGHSDREGVIPIVWMSLVRAKTLVVEIAHRGDALKSASFLPEEDVSVGGKTVRCYVIHYTDADFKTEPKNKQEGTIWIDNSTAHVVKVFTRRSSDRLGLPILVEDSIVYPVVELDGKEPASSFNFVPPADAKLVAEFPNPNAPRTGAVTDFVGKAAPELELQSGDGKIRTLSSFHGKPVFVDFWATWCGPCVSQLKDLKELHAETESKGLVWIGIDSDKDAATSDAFIARERISWMNYHDEGGSLGKKFQRGGIPLGILIDKEGIVTFYKSSYGISELRSAIAKLGLELEPAAAASMK
jgi:thiol-disulfide isomerase/thioredoxin